MKQGVLRSSRYSPGNMDYESLEAVFVGRDDIMEDVLDRITTSISGPHKHYILLVGPRGSGKTHLLALANHRLMALLDAGGTRNDVAIALLKEEEWGVASYLDFVVRILTALAENATELNAEIARIYSRFSKDAEEAEAFAVGLLRQHCEGKTLLLLCENLVDLFQGLGDEGQKRWRTAIQEDGNWTILATTPQLFAGVTLQNNPFYGFFTVRPLEKIDLDTGIDLLTKKAIHENKPDLADFLRSPLGRARARAIHHLAAGNHRAYVVMFDFLDKESLEDLIGPFMHMVDDLTPYYQDRMRQVPPAQRKIIEFLCLKRAPATVKAISTSCLMSPQTAAKQVGALAITGFVSRSRSGRNTFCELSEPLMRICIEVKDNKTQHVRLLVEFLRHWFTSRELAQRHAAYQHDVLPVVLDRLHVEEAVRCSLADQEEPFVDALHDEAKRCWDAGNYKGLATIQETLVRDTGKLDDYRMWVYALVQAGEGHSAVVAGREAEARYPGDSELLMDLTQAYFMEGRLDEALDAVDRGIQVAGDCIQRCARANILLRLRRFEEAVAEAEATLDVEPEHWHSFEQIIQGLVALGRVADAEARARELVQRAPTEADALVIAGRFEASQGRMDRGLEYADRAVSVDADHDEARELRGLLLFEMGEYRSAAMDLREHASRHGRSLRTHCRLADCLLVLGQFEEAVEVAGRLLEIDPTHDHAYFVRGSALMELDRPAEAVVAFDGLLEGSHFRWLLGASAYARAAGDYGAAERYLGRVRELEPDSRELRIERCRLCMDQKATEEALEEAVGIEELADSLLLGRLLAAQARAAREPLDVALEDVGIGGRSGYFEGDEQLYREVLVEILSTSVRNFGPRHLRAGVGRLRSLLASEFPEGVLGRILTDLLIRNVQGFVGSLDEWERALGGLESSLADLAECHIPLDMLGAAVAYTKTGDEKRLLTLPLEQRQLLEEVLPAQGNGRQVSRGRVDRDSVLGA